MVKRLLFVRISLMQRFAYSVCNLSRFLFPSEVSDDLPFQAKDACKLSSVTKLDLQTPHHDYSRLLWNFLTAYALCVLMHVRASLRVLDSGGACRWPQLGCCGTSPAPVIRRGICPRFFPSAGNFPVEGRPTPCIPSALDSRREFKHEPGLVRPSQTATHLGMALSPSKDVMQYWTLGDISECR